MTNIANMFQPVRCLRCHRGVYDLGKVTVTARYTDCSMWRTPCCDQLVDDRGDTGWSPRKDYERIDKNAPSQPNIYGLLDAVEIFGVDDTRAALQEIRERDGRG